MNVCNDILPRDPRHRQDLRIKSCFAAQKRQPTSVCTGHVADRGWPKMHRAIGSCQYVAALQASDP